MSSSQTPRQGSQGTTPQGGASAGDPSMEDILASIRRILSEDEAPAAPATPQPAAAKPAEETPGDGVLVLDPAMMVPDPVREAEPLVPMRPSVAAPPSEPAPSTLV